MQQPGGPGAREWEPADAATPGVGTARNVWPGHIEVVWYGYRTYVYIYIYIQMIRDKEIKKIGNADVSLGSTFVIRFSWLNPLVRWLETQESPVVPSPQLILFALCMIARGTQIHMTKNTLQDTKTHIRSLEAPLAQPWQVRAPSGVLGVLGI